MKDYFSKYEQKELKNKIEAIKKSEAGTLAKEWFNILRRWKWLQSFL